MGFSIRDGDLLSFDGEAIVNAWNRNIIPWWLLLPQGVSGAIKKAAGLRPFWELGWKGPIPLGGAVTTSAGRLPYQHIIHVAGIDMFWRASEASIRGSVRSALGVARDLNVKSLAFPVLGAGSGGYSESAALDLMVQELQNAPATASKMDIVIFRYRPASGGNRT